MGGLCNPRGSRLRRDTLAYHFGTNWIYRLCDFNFRFKCFASQLKIAPPSMDRRRSLMTLIAAISTPPFARSRLVLSYFRNQKRKKNFFCIFQDTVSQFWLRGLCSSSTLDTVYKLRQDLSNVHLIQNRHL